MASYLDHRRRQDPIITGHPGLVLLFAVLFDTAILHSGKSCLALLFSTAVQTGGPSASQGDGSVNGLDWPEECHQHWIQAAGIVLCSLTLLSRLVPMVGPTMNSPNNKIVDKNTAECVLLYRLHDRPLR